MSDQSAAPPLAPYNEAFVAHLVGLGLRDFASFVITRAFRGLPLTDEVLGNMRTAALAWMKEKDWPHGSDEQKAAMLKRADWMLRDGIATAISQARKMVDQHEAALAAAAGNAEPPQ